MDKIEIKGKNAYYIDSTTAEIDLQTFGIHAVIDIEDIMLAMEYKWSVRRRTVVSRIGSTKILALRRYLLDIHDPNRTVVHSDGNVYNCRRKNLLIIPRGDLPKYTAHAKRNLVGQHHVPTSDIPEGSTKGLSYNPMSIIGDEYNPKHYGIFTPLEWLGGDRYRCTVPSVIHYRGKFVYTLGIMDVTLWDLYSELDKRYNKYSNKFVKGHPKHDTLIDDHTLFKGKQLIADVKPERYKSVEPGPRPEPDSWYESGKYVVYHRMKLRIVDKKWIEKHLDPAFWGEGGI